MREARFRSIAKAITWRFIATCTTMGIAYVATRDFEVVAVIGMADVLIKLFFYYVHERAWGRIPLGRNVHFGKE